MDNSSTSLFWDFLSFRVLMTPAILVVVYYFGAILGPLAVFWFFRKTSQVQGEETAVPKRGRLRDSLDENRSLLIGVAVVVLVLMEIFWRMMFEFFIAYFQIHNALMGMG